MKGRTKRVAEPPLPVADAVRVKAAQLWLELGNAQEAARELHQLSAVALSYPQVLALSRKVKHSLRHPPA